MSKSNGNLRVFIEACRIVQVRTASYSKSACAEDSAEWSDDDGGRNERMMGTKAIVPFERVLSAAGAERHLIGEVQNSVQFLRQKLIIDAQELCIGQLAA